LSLLGKENELLELLIRVDIGDHPRIQLAQKLIFHFERFSIVIWVLDFQGHFGALEDVFLVLLEA
jgi:hypothetical protein